MTNKCIAFSLWGNNPKYNIGAIKNAELASTIYPEWKCVFFISESSVPEQTKIELEKFDHVIVKTMNGSDSWSNLFWRFQTCFDPQFDVCIFRDTDSRLSMREKYAVDYWLKQNKTIHIMRDHPHHGYPILGGMWGYRKNNKYNIEELLKNYVSKDKYGTDYEFLGNTLYPLIKDDKVVHDEFFDKKPFPTMRQGTEFVGDVYDENDIRHPEFFKFIPL
jgi:hypothetical protein